MSAAAHRRPWGGRLRRRPRARRRPVPRRPAGGARRARGRPARRCAGGRRLAAPRLERAGIPLGPDAFVVIVAALAAGAGALGLAAARTPLAGLIGAVAVAAGAVSLVRSADRRHLARVERQLPGVAQQLAAAIHAGLSLRQALARSARDAPEPIRAELERAVGELALGGRLEGALEGLAARLPAHDLRIMVTAVLVQRRTGGNLARALADLSGRIEERAQLERELRGSTAQARMTAWLVAALPVAGGAMAELAAPGTLVRLLGSGPGPALLVASTAPTPSVCCGSGASAGWSHDRGGAIVSLLASPVAMWLAALVCAAMALRAGPAARLGGPAANRPCRWRFGSPPGRDGPPRSCTSSRTATTSGDSYAPGWPARCPARRSGASAPAGSWPEHCSRCRWSPPGPCRAPGAGAGRGGWPRADPMAPAPRGRAPSGARARVTGPSRPPGDLRRVGDGARSGPPAGGRATGRRSARSSSASCATSRWAPPASSPTGRSSTGRARRSSPEPWAPCSRRRSSAARCRAPCEGQAEALRVLRRQTARERAARAAPKIQLVVALLMVPAVLMLVLGALVIELSRQVGTVVGGP